MNIVHDLVGLNRSVEDYPLGLGKEDKKYIKLEEFLTRCLIKFDGIERNSEVLIKTLKQLVNFTNRLLTKLEEKATTVSAPSEIETAESIAAKKKKNKKKTGAAKQESVDEGEQQAVTEKPEEEKKSKAEAVVEVDDVKIVEEEAAAQTTESIEDILKKKGKTKKPKKK